MESVINTILSFFIDLNPITVNWQSSGDVLEYVLRLILFAVIVSPIVFTLLYFKRVRQFLGNVKNELQKVTWLPRNQTVRYTIITIFVIILVVFIIILLDQAFLFLRNLLIFRGI